MDKKQKEKLKELVEMGKWNYVFTKGVLYWGGIMFIVFTIFGYLFYPDVWKEMITFNAVLWGIAGLIFGLWTWSSINKKLKEK